MGEIKEVIEVVGEEGAVIGMITFLLTMQARKKIKKKSEKLKEEKRKLVNSVLIVIPFVISLMISGVYVYLTKREIEIERILKVGSQGWVVAMGIYAVYERGGIVIRGLAREEKESLEDRKEIKKKK